jgi:DNA-binding XRE family transcriptional regulator
LRLRNPAVKNRIRPLREAREWSQGQLAFTIASIFRLRIEDIFTP